MNDIQALMCIECFQDYDSGVVDYDMDDRVATLGSSRLCLPYVSLKYMLIRIVSKPRVCPQNY